MNKTLVAVACLISGSLNAAQNKFDLNLDLSLEGKHVLSPQLTVQEGEKRTVNFESDGVKKFIEVSAKETASSNGQSAIYMSFVVGKISEDGTRTIISAPRIIASPNQKAQISISENGKDETISVTAVANKVAL